VSDSVASLAPLQLALEPQTQVVAANFAKALRCQFLPTAIVVECSSTLMADAAGRLQERFSKTTVIVMRHNDTRRPAGRSSSAGPWPDRRRCGVPAAPLGCGPDKAARRA